MGLRSGEAVPVKGLPLYLSVDAPLLVQSSGATLPKLSRPPLWSSHLVRCSHCCGRVTLQVLMRGTPFDHRCGRVAWQGLKKGGGFSGTALGRRPQNRTKGADPRTGTPLKRNVFLPWCPVSSLSWPACAWSLLAPVRWFSGLAPSGSWFVFVPPLVSFYWPRASRSSSRREGRRVKRKGTDPSTSTGHRPKDRLLQVLPLRTALLLYLVVPDLFFPLSFAILFCGGPGIVFLVSFTATTLDWRNC